MSILGMNLGTLCRDLSYLQNIILGMILCKMGGDLGTLSLILNNIPHSVQNEVCFK